VATIDGVAFYNDSKATNVAAAGRSLEAFDGRVLAILGGRYKGGDFAALASPLRARGSRVLAIGEARDRLQAALGEHVPVDACSSLREAVARARSLAEPGDTVLLAPACSSLLLDHAMPSAGLGVHPDCGGVLESRGAAGSERRRRARLCTRFEHSETNSFEGEQGPRRGPLGISECGLPAAERSAPRYPAAEAPLPLGLRRSHDSRDVPLNG
jgi:hypothetical protein